MFKQKQLFKMNSGPRVTVTKGIVNMEDFYLLTVKELPELTSLVKNENMLGYLLGREGEAVSFFLQRLSIALLNDLGRTRKLSGSLPEVGNAVWNVDVCEGFLRIVKEWLEENNGRGNLLQITEAMRSNGRATIAVLLEQLFLRYFLPLAANDDEGHESAIMTFHENNVYSLSRNVNSDICSSKSAMDVNSSVERALQNSVILEEVFKKLQPKDQKAFRLANPVWMEETFSFWRRSAQLRIEVTNAGDRITRRRKGITMSSYMDLVELDRKLQGPKSSTASGSNYELVKHPFRRYKLSYEDHGKNSRRLTSFFCRPAENNFWKLCGPQIEDLQIEDASFKIFGEDNKSLYKTCQMLLLDTCPSLKKLKISKSWNMSYSYSGARGPPPSVKTCRRKTFVKKQDFAGNLHTLIIETRTFEIERILFICPGLKTLVLDIEEDITITGLAHPKVTGEYIQLETLKIKYPCNRNHDFVPLLKYAELLTNKKFNSLKNLCLDGIKLFDARRSPFDLYAAIAHCSCTLKSLNLTMLVTQRDDLQGERKWFADLSSFSFPNLTSLKLGFDFRQSGLDPNHIKFDFRTLEGMRMLEQLEIKVGKNDVRNPGSQDWICEGDRTSYLPRRVSFALISDADPILCQKLKEFTFMGWSLNEEDIKILSSWFPNLTQLDAVVKPDAVPHLENWKRLEQINMKPDRLVSLLRFRPLKEKIKHLRVIQTIPGLFGRTKCVELKEGNGMLYFSEVKGDK